ncbi:hypothetical protein Leryth_021198 [Lithospermum erythrorhizon]|uniref:Uncharacterized protein n=1 Tax=Lithospermum erythrorhizon TaxID=34254 RepID=A0AAV3RRC8_LITER|nr:hypothetical protein Leryth_021198 [Lithospermum erythrorhizon]
MVYLLENTLIFLPLAQKQHRQVSGLSIKNTCFAVLNRASNNYQNRSSSHLGFERKREKANEVATKSTEQQTSCPSETSLLLCSSTCMGIKSQHLAQFHCHGSKGFLQSPSEDNVAKTVAEDASNEKHIPYIQQHNSNGIVALPKKRSRQWRWQRQRDLKSRKFSLGPCREGVLDKFQALQTCSCCSTFQSLPDVNEEDHLNRRIMLYKMEDCSSVFPRKRILISGSCILRFAFSAYKHLQN